MPYQANFHIVGCLPNGVETFDNIEDAWQHLIDMLGDNAWEPDNEDDPNGPHSLTYLALKMQAFADQERIGCVYEPGGLGVYEVEWVDSVHDDPVCPGPLDF